jgi:hypothetical protein
MRRREKRWWERREGYENNEASSWQAAQCGKWVYDE